MKLLEKYNIDFKNEELINTALTHSSYANEHNTISYERLEFLGDAILELLMSEYLYKNTELPEGKMSKIRSGYVCENALFEYSKEIDLKSYIKIGNSITEPNKAVIADTLEAVIAVVYLENGIDTVRNLFDKLIVPNINLEDDFLHDYKSLLQEMVQTDRKSLEYVLVDETGPAHDKTFKVNVLIEGMVFGTGSGKTKKEAEQNAAKDAYNKKA